MINFGIDAFVRYPPLSLDFILVDTPYGSPLEPLQVNILGGEAALHLIELRYPLPETNIMMQQVLLAPTVAKPDVLAPVYQLRHGHPALIVVLCLNVLYHLFIEL